MYIQHIQREHAKRYAAHFDHPCVNSMLYLRVHELFAICWCSCADMYVLLLMCVYWWFIQYYLCMSMDNGCYGLWTTIMATITTMETY